MTAEQAESLPGIGRGVEIIEGVISQLQPQLVEDADDPDEVTTTLQPPQLLLNPDPFWHFLPEWLTAVASSLIFHGDSFAYRGPEVCDARGYPQRLPLLEAERMTWQDGEYIHQSDSGQTHLSPPDVWHALVGARSGKRFGRGILEKYQLELKIMLVTEQSQFVIMKNGKPMGILSLGLDVNTEMAKTYKQSFLDAVKQDGVAAIGNADFKPVQWSSADLSMVDTREFNLRLASDIIGIPPYLLGVPSESRVYANMETEWSTFLKVTLGRYLRAIESAMSSCFPRGKTVKFDLDQLLRSDAKTRFEVYGMGISMGALTVDEVRHRENLPPLPKQPIPLAPVKELPTDKEDPDADPAAA